MSHNESSEPVRETIFGIAMLIALLLGLLGSCVMWFFNLSSFDQKVKVHKLHEVVHNGEIFNYATVEYEQGFIDRIELEPNEYHKSKVGEYIVVHTKLPDNAKEFNDDWNFYSICLHLGSAGWIFFIGSFGYLLFKAD